MIKRTLSAKLESYARHYPVVTVTGPRQSGKTTLCRALFSSKRYFSLESLDNRKYAHSDPRSFLRECVKRGAVIDEIQRVPELLSYIQGVVDEKDTAGLFILTGSQNFQLLNKISQSLAGRTALAVLLPFSYSEVYKHSIVDIGKLIFTGFYPRIHDKKLNPREALSFYVSTYLERDIRELINVKDLSKFEIFLKLCAARVGQLVNLSSLANDCGINHNTAKSWLSVLEASYVIFFVRPHHANFGKRLVKSPKLYFSDVGLAAHLLDIQNSHHVDNHPLKGCLFENFVVSELLKERFNRGLGNNLYFFRDNVGNEVDILLDYGTKVQPIEIKLGETINEDFFKGLRYYKKISLRVAADPVLIYGGADDQLRGDYRVISYRNIVSLIGGKKQA